MSGPVADQEGTVAERWHILGYCWLLSIVPITLVFWVWLGPLSPDRIRQAGIVFQIIGISTVFFGIRNTRHQFRGPDAPPDALERMVALIRFYGGRARRIALRLVGRQRPVEVKPSAAVLIAESGAAADLQATVRVPPATTIEERVANLEAAIGRIQENLRGEFAAALSREVTPLREAQRGEEHLRAKEDSRITEFFTNAHTGGLKLSSFGAVCLAVGTILGGMPDEVFRCVNWMVRW